MGHQFSNLSVGPTPPTPTLSPRPPHFPPPSRHPGWRPLLRAGRRCGLETGGSVVLQEACGRGMENGGRAAAGLSPGEASLAWSVSSDGAKEHSGPEGMPLGREQDLGKGLDSG